MTKNYRLAFWCFVLGAHLACTPQRFEAIPNKSCLDYNSRYGDATCTLTEDGLNTFDYSLKFGQADILFVDDNSGSMSTEQTLMANRFSNFINQLFSQDIDYRIGIITTDISASPNQTGPKAANGNGAFQDGKLLVFKDSSGDTGKVAIDKSYSMSRADDMFRNTIQRKETLACEAAHFATASCPSDNERGIYAANLAIQRNQDAGTDANGSALGSFIRPNGHLALVVLSDEDERSGPSSAYYTNQETYDMPTTLAHQFAALYPLKTLSVHSIVVKSGDSGCLQTQNNQGANVISSYGKYYEQLSNLSWPADDLTKTTGSPYSSRGSLVQGFVGSICAGDYLSLVQAIADRIAVPPIGLACENPENLQFEVSGSSGTYTPVVNGSQLTFQPNLPAGATLHLNYKCPR